MVRLIKTEEEYTSKENNRRNISHIKGRTQIEKLIVS
jgi:hypothetical protein